MSEKSITIARIKPGKTFIGELQETGDNYATFENQDKELIKIPLPVAVIEEIEYQTYDIFKIENKGNDEFTVTKISAWPEKEKQEPKSE